MHLTTGGATNAVVVGVYPRDIVCGPLVAACLYRRDPGDGCSVGARRDLPAVFGQLPADRLDREHLPVLVDEPHERGCDRSSSAAKKTDAALRISLARLSSATSRRSFLISAASWDVTPGRAPALTSAWRTHLRSVSAVPIPSFCATAPIAAHSDS